ncbi:hypothetical protein ACFXTH_046547 [Malus domestica]
MDKDREANTRYVASSLEVLFLNPRVVSLTDEDAQVGVPQVVELGDLPKEVTDKSIRTTHEFEGQNKSIKSRVRSTLVIWDTFAIDKVVDVSGRVLFRFSPHASLYPSHLPYLFLRQMWYLLWKHKMMKMSTREQCQISNQVRTRLKEKTGKNMIWDTLAFNPDDMRYSCFGVACLQRYYREEKKLSISRDSAESALSDVKKS